MAPNQTRKKHFNAYQIELHYLKRHENNEVDAKKWDKDFIVKLLNGIFKNNLKDRTKNFGSWILFLDELQNEEHYIFGRFISAEYGTVGDLIHVDLLTSRTNPRDLREGEQQATHFLIRKSDGLLLLQTSQRVQRSKVATYFDELGKSVIEGEGLTYINVCTLVNTEFFDNVRSLDKVNSTVVEIASKQSSSDENEVIKNMQGEIEKLKGTHVKLEFLAKRQREGLLSVLPFIELYKDKPGVTAIKVVGKQDGAERTFNLESFSEKYGRKVKVDANNQPISEDMYDNMKEVAKKRNRLLTG
jgi:hypothetical protein